MKDARDMDISEDEIEVKIMNIMKQKNLQIEFFAYNGFSWFPLILMYKHYLSKKFF